MNTEILNQLTKLALQKSKPFCYSCYHEVTNEFCDTCGSDDHMNLLPGHGCEYGTMWIIQAILEEELNSVNLEEEFENFMHEVYPETTQVAWMNLDTIQVAKEIDPIAWDIAQSEWVDEECSQEDLLTFDNGSTYFRRYDIESLIESQLQT